MRRILVLGYGNPGRGDDGLGPALAEALAAERLDGVTVDIDYQLTVEDSAAAAEHDVVIFADAARTGAAPFAMQPVEPDDRPTFSTHSETPAGVVALARTLFGARPQCYTLAIRGYAFDENCERLTSSARENLVAAIEFMKRLLPLLGRRGTVIEHAA